MPFPKKIDDNFNAISEYKRNNYPIKYWIENPLKRYLKCFLILFLALAGLMKYQVED